MIDLSSYVLPKLPGVYIFKDIYNNILYIGKAKNLHNRIISYKTDRQIDWKLHSLLQQSNSVEWIIAETEKQALLLEADLISEQKPLFNKLLTADNPFSYIVFRKKDSQSMIEVTRYYSNKYELIIGPFLVKKEAVELYEYILYFFNLFICKKKIKHGCLNYHIGKCAGWCKEDFDSAGYEKRYALAKSALKSEESFIKLLDVEIKKAKKKFNFSELEKLITYKLQYCQLCYQLEKNKKNIDTVDSILLNIILEEVVLHKALLQLQEILHLTKTPKIIDCVDISHFQGHSVTGACVRFIEGKYSKEYSKSYKLPLDENNDYKNLIFLVANHYKQITDYPDILLIDGGKGQLSSILALNLPITLIALAKKIETLFTPYAPEGLVLTPQEPYGKLLIALRNATHNAAIRLHRKIFNTYNRETY
jgi:excinuclease ABC subunit C